MKNIFLVKPEIGMKKYKQLENCHGKHFQKGWYEKEQYLRLVHRKPNIVHLMLRNKSFYIGNHYFIHLMLWEPLCKWRGIHKFFIFTQVWKNKYFNTLFVDQTLLENYFNDSYLNVFHNVYILGSQWLCGCCHQRCYSCYRW